MTHTHNCMLRGLNSIYHQAENVQKPEDITDLLFFILKILQDYSVHTKPAGYDPSIIRKTIEVMGPSFRDHLGDEIDSLLRVIDYNSEALMKVYKSCVAEATKQDKQVVPPMVLGLRDVTFEGGNQWPSLPPMAGWVINYFFARKHSHAWRFLPCDGWGKPRRLAFGPKREAKK